ncbi:uncharacterized protein LOC106465103 isoform X2 [Limulus polyphemus]|uniref:Uncharacterized protein LOC106465103 isoform X2 n=1 Tax=Limulus polyphemus TaxID=6850 RepID=A0ABM1SYE4_LIMPO|nr:uncharacterized protein LOC106465103 isoform X2 [Limulus polyphemus]
MRYFKGNHPSLFKTKYMFKKDCFNSLLCSGTITNSNTYIRTKFSNICERQNYYFCEQRKSDALPVFKLDLIQATSRNRRSGLLAGLLKTTCRSLIFSVYRPVLGFHKEYKSNCFYPLLESPGMSLLKFQLPLKTVDWKMTLLPIPVNRSQSFMCYNCSSKSTSQKEKNCFSFYPLPKALRQFSTSAVYYEQEKPDVEGDGKDDKTANSLTDFPHIVWPSLFLTVKNWIQTKIIIQPYLDKQFNHKDFVVGAKQALGVVSSLLAVGDFEGLDGLVTQNAIAEIKKNYLTLNVQQRQELEVKLNDIYFCFPYQIGIMLEDGLYENTPKE